MRRLWVLLSGLLLCYCTSTVRSIPYTRLSISVQPMPEQPEKGFEIKDGMIWVTKDSVHVGIEYVSPERLDAMYAGMKERYRLSENIYTHGEQPQQNPATGGYHVPVKFTVFNMVVVNQTRHRIFLDPSAMLMIDLKRGTQYGALGLDYIKLRYYPRSSDVEAANVYKHVVQLAQETLFPSGLIPSDEVRAGFVLFRPLGKPLRRLRLIVPHLDLTPDAEEMETLEFFFDFEYTAEEEVVVPPKKDSGNHGTTVPQPVLPP